MTEVACEPERTCQDDEHAYKGLTAQWMGEAMQVAPFTTDTISSYLQSSALGAAKQCSGGHNRTTCGTHWTENEFDGITGLGQEMSALNVFLANLAVNSSAPTNAYTTSATTQTNNPSGTPTAQANSISGTSTVQTNSTTATPTATPVKPSSDSQRLWPAGWTLSLVFPAALLSFLSLF